MGEENRMNKVVFFTEKQKLSDALENFNLESFKNKKVPVKLHMGEIKNKYSPQAQVFLLNIRAV